VKADHRPPGVTVHDVEPHWPRSPRPSDGAPNVVVIVLDDVGFAQVGPFGSSIETPSIDGLAASGLRYSNFHATALCSTTRACLLTGRNNHAVGMGFLADFDTGYSNARGSISHSAATIAEVLSSSGYGTHAVGKWHLTSPAHMSPVGPFDQWPTGRGFDRWYGFLWGEDDQWAPELWQDQHRIDPPQRPGYHFSEDIADRAIGYIADHVTADPARPFLSYVAFGACHAPHQAPRSFIDKYKGRFDEGWDVERERVLDRQKKLGIVPATTRLAPRNPGVQAWSDLSSEERGLYARMQEVFAGFMEHTDVQIGRLLGFLRDIDVLDNTLVVLLSDNGASGEGGRYGSVNEYRYFLGLEDSLRDNLDAADQLGGPWTHNHYPAGWAQAGNTPFKYYKHYTFAGGVRTPLIVKPPVREAFTSGVRDQFHHVIDVAPTILDLAGIAAPDEYRGVAQLPIHGTSMRYTFSEPGVATTRQQQYFEAAGHRGLIRGGWKALTHHAPGTDYGVEQWQLYRVDDDRSETVDLADTHPDVIEALAQAWWSDAERFGVLPLDDRARERAGVVDPASTKRTAFRFFPGTRALNRVTGPDFAGRDFEIRAEVRYENGVEGVLLAHGRRAAGFSLYLKDGRLHFDYNLAGHHTVVTSNEQVTPGETSLGVRVATMPGGGAVATLRIGAADCGFVEIDRTLPGGFGCLSTQAGHNSPSPASAAYHSPFRFTGVLRHVDVVLAAEQSDVSLDVWNHALASE
jgi:arylsulfatase A-like enzyme